ncbi:hypothetical protein CSC94_02575 [Zhengella mangrovi]|uniref:DUF680 domain-containing protein n=1 Tax=Zhengella mangrovi TaxID=1982044 RepID=A0A2G1QTP0_9HYPH|nr:hypothetical protein [Zhengella mangrovi]PHP68893.1 hypothetical protein CSC94_02575 [Zhengella mangrovi]
MKKIVLAAFAAATALSTAAFAEEPPQINGNYSSDVQQRYNMGPAESGTYVAPMMLDRMPTASVDRDDRAKNMADDRMDPELNYSANVDKRDILD